MQVASAYGHEPVATTSLLAYVLCHDLHPTLEEKVAWLGVLGTFGDLGSSVKWHDPFPDMTGAIKQHGGKTKFSQAVSLINARELPHASPWHCLALSFCACGLSCNHLLLLCRCQLHTSVPPTLSTLSGKQPALHSFEVVVMPHVVNDRTEWTDRVLRSAP